MMVECEDTKYKDNNDNETENPVTWEKETEKCPDIKSPEMMEECGNKEHGDKYNNETETNIVTMDKETEKFPDITSPAMME